MSAALSYKARQLANHVTAGDAMVRELDLSQITLRLVEEVDTKGDDENDKHVMAKLQGSTLDVLKRCLV